MEKAMAGRDVQLWPWMSPITLWIIRLEVDYLRQMTLRGRQRQGLLGPRMQRLRALQDDAAAMQLVVDGFHRDRGA